ncbi:PEP-CTERM sorting domain-containing protein [Kordiimonas laminariae]|uniref:PEP-CTERM sorting domain-containing protein n=1 Tax=Kordiimonas laminariae TaxID=2917717 RepID=UPI001FF239C0|nr:PEP-CTERM sorting domain-containing protein [Kordiimonas laminariae]MCK0069683.1 PEP-CTERM sorting domain-containing protein [Kordiimonas laminariae]
MMKNFIKTVKVCLAAIGCSLLVSAPSQATFPILTTDVGLYTPTTIGNNLLLDACGTTVNGFSLCDLASYAAFRVRWDINGVRYARFRDFNNSNFDGAVADGLQLTVPTGLGTVFPTVGVYTIKLSVRILRSNTTGVGTIALPNGTILNVSSSQHLTSNDTTTVNIVATPEPGTLLILLLALGFIGYRINQRKAV